MKIKKKMYVDLINKYRAEKQAIIAEENKEYLTDE